MVRAANERSPWLYPACALWASLCVYLSLKGLGTPAFVASVFMALYFFGFDKRWQGEDSLSAYSVFNEGGKELIGTFNTQEIERQVRGSHGVAALQADRVEREGGGRISSKRPLTSRDSPSSTHVRQTVKLSEDERVKRRVAAAEAAERRMKAASGS